MHGSPLCFFFTGGGRRDDQQAESYEKWQVDAVQRTGVLGLLRIGSISCVTSTSLGDIHGRGDG
jgi:hypothetical protein